MIGHVLYTLPITVKNRIRELKTNVGIIFPPPPHVTDDTHTMHPWIYIAEEVLELSGVLIQGQPSLFTQDRLTPSLGKPQSPNQGTRSKV